MFSAEDIYINMSDIDINYSISAGTRSNELKLGILI
jgi:hypothetical protein